MGRIVLTVSAIHDLDEIWDYIAIENESPDAADSLIDEIHNKLPLVAEQPLMGEAVDHLRATRGGSSSVNAISTFMK